MRLDHLLSKRKKITRDGNYILALMIVLAFVSMMSFDKKDMTANGLVAQVVRAHA